MRSDVLGLRHSEVWEDIARRLSAILRGQPADMHEPDGVTVAGLVGTHLDNAHGCGISGQALTDGHQEFVLVLEREGQEGGEGCCYEPGERDTFNVSSLLALAMVGARAVIAELDSCNCVPREDQGAWVTPDCPVHGSPTPLDQG